MTYVKHMMQIITIAQFVNLTKLTSIIHKRNVLLMLEQQPVNVQPSAQQLMNV